MYLNSDMFIIVDILIVAIVALCLYIGFKKGFIYQLADLLSFVIAFVVAWFLGPLLAEHIKFYTLEDSLLEAMAQPLINNLIWFVIIVIIVKIIFAFILPTVYQKRSISPEIYRSFFLSSPESQASQYSFAIMSMLAVW